MKAYLLDRPTWVEGKIDVFHYCMFHGEASRPGLPEGFPPSHSTGDDLSVPVHLSRSGSRIPHLFLPGGGTTMVISESTKTAIEKVPNVAFLPVVFAKLVDVPYHVGDFSYKNDPAYKRDWRRYSPETLIKRRRDRPELHKNVGTFYEVIVPHYRYLFPTYGAEGKWRFRLNRETVKIDFEPRVLKEYPLFHGDYYIMTESVLKLLDPFIDWDYFELGVSNVHL